jgi:hypothetical protein
MGFKDYLREAEKKTAKAKCDVVATTSTGNSEIPGHYTGYVTNPSQTSTDNIVLTNEQQGNLEAYNVMRQFAQAMEANLSSITVLRSHPTQEIASGAAVLEKDIRSVINYILNLQIPL